MSDILKVKVRTITETEKKDGYIVTVDEQVEAKMVKTALGMQKRSQFGKSFSTKVFTVDEDGKPIPDFTFDLKKDDIIELDLDDYDQKDEEFEITDPNSDRYGEMTTKTWLYLK